MIITIRPSTSVIPTKATCAVLSSWRGCFSRLHCTSELDQWCAIPRPMHLSNLLHDNRGTTESQSPSLGLSPSHYSDSEARATAAMGPTLAGNPYTQTRPLFGYPNRSPQPPPSPPVEEARCSLPSISSLFSSADGGSPTPSEHGMSPPFQLPRWPLTANTKQTDQNRSWVIPETHRTIS